jgi:hypothetical protein
MRKYVLMALGLLLVAAMPAAAQPQDNRAQVHAAVVDYVEGFYEGDSTKLVRSVATHVRKYGYGRSPADSAYRSMTMPYDGFMRFAAGVRAGRNVPPAGAPRDIEIFDVQDQTASAKLTAWWGIDYLLLARENGRWMITHVLWQSPRPRGRTRATATERAGSSAGGSPSWEGPTAAGVQAFVTAAAPRLVRVRDKILRPAWDGVRANSARLGLRMTRTGAHRSIGCAPVLRCSPLSARSLCGEGPGEGPALSPAG